MPRSQPTRARLPGAESLFLRRGSDVSEYQKVGRRTYDRTLRRIDISSTMNSYRSSGSPPLRPDAQLLDSYCALLRRYGASGKLEPPDEERVEEESDRQPQLSLLELEYPAHHIEDQR